MIVHVTQEDIDNGERGECRICPIALALERATGRKWDVLATFAIPCGIYESSVVWGDKSPAFQFVLDFDKGRPVSPFSFEFDYAPCVTQQ